MKKLIAAVLTLCLLLCSLSFAAAEEKSTPSIAIVVAGTLGDRSFYDSAKEGLDQLAAEFGTKTTVVECNEGAAVGYFDGLWTAAAGDPGKGIDGSDIIAAVGWQFYDDLTEVAEAFPDKKFLFIDNALEEIPANVMCITYAQNQGSFLVGYIAGKLTATGAVGAVGGEDADTINDFLVGYAAGAQYAREDAQVRFQYANTYEDPAIGKECANALYSTGCDIVFAVAGKTGEGVFEAAREADKLAIGVDGDQKYIDPDRIICSMVKRVGKSIYDVVSDPEAFFKGGETWNADMATGYIDVVYGTEDMPQQASDELKAEVEQLKEKIISGEIEVPTAFK
jgi:basic membrane protein A